LCRSDLLLQTETNRRPSSAVDSLIMEDQRRRLSEAGVNRRPSAAHVLTEDTDSFIIGQKVFVDGVKPGRIQFIGTSLYSAARREIITVRGQSYVFRLPKY
jgi:hypothetical protein